MQVEAAAAQLLRDLVHNPLRPATWRQLSFLYFNVCWWAVRGWL